MRKWVRMVNTVVMEEDVEVLFESWLLKLTGLESRSTFRLSSQWKKRYFILLRQGETASVFYYNSKPGSLDEIPKGHIPLEEFYKVEKKHNVRGQRFVVSLTTLTKRLVVAVEDEKIFHLLAFFLQAQVKLRDDYTGECFVVRPDNSEDQRKIGARGSMCLLHVSPWGVTLALQLSKSVLVQWPLSSIRNYESTGRGQFVLTAGKKATMGIGKYIFNTRLGQDNAIYDRLDQYIVDATGFRLGAADSVSDLSVSDQENLHLLTVVHPDPQFSNHLRKISRDIYDHLWQHLGSARMKTSSPDLVSDSPHTRHMARAGSMPVLESSTPSFPRNPMPRKHSQTTSPLASPEDFSSLPRNFTRTPPHEGGISREAGARAQVFPLAIDSQYLHPLNPYNDVPPVFEEPESPSPPSTETDSVFSLSKSPETTALPSGDGKGHQEGAEKSPTPPGRSSSSERSVPRQRLRSHSCEDLIAYMAQGGMAKRSNEYVYNNTTFEMDSPEVKSSARWFPTDHPDQFLYSYATQDEVDRTRAAAQRLVQRQTANAGVDPTRQTNPHPTGNIRHPLVRYNSLKKAMSNPSLIESGRTKPLMARETNFKARLAPEAEPKQGRPPAALPDTTPPQAARFTVGVRGEWNTSPPQHQRHLVETQASPPLSMSPPGVAKVTASPPKAVIEMPRGISATNKTRVFRRPVKDKPSVQRNISLEQEERDKSNIPRQESTSSGYASGNQENDVKETTC